jgi:hypothetical protein
MRQRAHHALTTRPMILEVAFILQHVCGGHDSAREQLQIFAAEKRRHSIRGVEA